MVDKVLAWAGKAPTTNMTILIGQFWFSVMVGRAIWDWTAPPLELSAVVLTAMGIGGLQFAAKRRTFDPEKQARADRLRNGQQWPQMGAEPPNTPAQAPG